ncbi:putative edge expressed protein [Cardiosporidium cionae]|uniref:Edge expressed protein n=1 Tax=Cardiosporidium cionae TaxID=476202 RepID=A0ABQ7JGC2_9APIC|nr:putative edge expressed protein [Cardiosporidium cionae]|eukprot:KAF8823073.1 putative edge expressed protein [Cardiosporidium cionae]
METNPSPAQATCEKSENIFKNLMKGILEHIEAHNFYDAYHKLNALNRRFSSRVSPEFLVKEYFVMVSVLAKHKEYSLMLETLKDIISFYEKNSIPPTEERIFELVQFFKATEKQPLPNPSMKYLIINRALNWSKTEACPEGNSAMHLAAAVSHFHDRNFGSCQNHLVYCDNVSLLVLLINEWQKDVYPSERSLLTLRLILILLSIARIQLASKLLQSLEINLNSKSVPAPVQFAYLLVEACLLHRLEFFELVKKKYQLVIRRDQSFPKLLNGISKTVFNQKIEAFDIFSLLSKIKF